MWCHVKAVNTGAVGALACVLAGLQCRGCSFVSLKQTDVLAANYHGASCGRWREMMLLMKANGVSLPSYTADMVPCVERTKALAYIVSSAVVPFGVFKGI